MARFFNISAKRRGGISFLRIGRINISISVSRPVAPLPSVEHGAIRSALLQGIALAPSAERRAYELSLVRAAILRNRSI